MEYQSVFFKHIQHILFERTLLNDILHLEFYLRKMYTPQKTKHQSKYNLTKVVVYRQPTRTNQSSSDVERIDTGQS